MARPASPGQLHPSAYLSRLLEATANQYPCLGVITRQHDQYSVCIGQLDP